MRDDLLGLRLLLGLCRPQQRGHIRQAARVAVADDAPALAGLIDGRAPDHLTRPGGFEMGEPVDGLCRASWDRMMNLNAWSFVAVTKAFVPQMLGDGAGKVVAVFRDGDRYFAIDNVDPKSGASVLSRGLVGNLGERLVVASPLYKNHFDLRTGECLEAPEHSVRSHAVRVEQGKVQVALT